MKEIRRETNEEIRQYGKLFESFKDDVCTVCGYKLEGLHEDDSTLLAVAKHHLISQKCREELKITKEYLEEFIKGEQRKEEIRNEGEETKEYRKKFIFNEKEIYRRALFPFLKLKEGIYGFGVMLPYWEERKDERGEITSTEQRWRPVVVSSDSKLHEINNAFRRKHRIDVGNVPTPTDYPRRWAVGSIGDFLDGKGRNANLRKLFLKIRETYEKHYATRERMWYDIHALWDIGTYFILLFTHYPFIELRGVRGSAKSRLLTISRLFTFNATEEMTNPSEATLYRLTEEQRPSKYVDEAEKLYKTVKGKVESDSRAELLNASFSRNGAVPRQEKDQFGRFYTKMYHVYSPLMIASINGLQGATEDRAILHVSVKSDDKDTRGDVIIDDESPAYQEIRNELYITALLSAERIEKEYMGFENTTKLRARDFAQVWKPILALAKAIEKDGEEGLLKRTLDFAEKLTEIKKLDSIGEGSFEYNVLEAAFNSINDVEGWLSLGRMGEYWKEKHGVDRIPGSRTFSIHLDRMGLKELKEHGRDGNGYSICKKDFVEIISPICPHLFSSILSSQSSHVHTQTKGSQESVKIGEHGEARKRLCEDGDSREAKMDGVEEIHPEEICVKQRKDFSSPSQPEEP